MTFLEAGTSTCLFSDAVSTNVPWSTILSNHTSDSIDSVEFLQDEGPAFVRLDDIRVQNCLFRRAGKVHCRR